MHGEKEKSGRRLADIMYIQIFWHGARHRQLHRKRTEGTFKLKIYNINAEKALDKRSQKCLRVPVRPP